MLSVRSSVRNALVLLVVAPGSAFAQTRICSYAVGDWVDDVEEIEAQLAVPEGEAPNLKEAGILIEVMDREWECLSAPVPPATLQLYAQIRAYQAFHSGDPDGALRWNRAQQYIEPGGQWPAWVADYHPLREQLEWEDPTEVTTVEGEYVNHPKKGGVFMNGRFLKSATAPVEVPALVQVYDKKQQRVMIYWQEGASFRNDLLTEDAAVAAKAKSPIWFVAPPKVAVPDAVVEAEPEPEPEPVVEAEPEPEPEPEPVVAEPEPEPEPEPVVAEPEPEPEPAVVEAEPEPEPVAEPEPEPEPEPAVVEAEPEPEPEPAVADAEAAPAATDAAVGVFAGLTPANATRCAKKTSSDDLRKALSWGVDKYVENDKRALDQAWDEALETAACLSKVVDRSAASSMHKLQAYIAYHSGQDEQAVAALRVALELDPSLEIAVRVAPEGDPLLDVLAAAQQQGPITKVTFEPPGGATAFVDGAESNVRPSSVPSLVQVQASGTITWSGWVLDGEGAPEWLASATSDSN